MSTTNTVILMNIEKICRICLIEGDNMKSVFSKLDDSQLLEINISNLSDVLTRITNLPISIDDGFPSMVCSNCWNLAYGAYKFKVQFDHSYTILQQYITGCVKIETQTNVLLDYTDSNSFEYESNVADDFIDSIARSQEKQFGKRRTSQKQIGKRQSNTSVEIRQQSRKRGRKRKFKLLNEDDDNNEEEEEDKVRDASENDVHPIKHPCPICTKEFIAVELRQHAQTHKALKKYLRIPQDTKVGHRARFYKEVDCRNQVIGLHSREEKLHKCVLCDWECGAEQLQVHFQTHRNQTEYQCDQCQRVFRKLNHLNTHRVKHLKECPFKCEQCGKGFVIKTNYDCHMLTHNTNQELPHECKYCLKRFSNPEHLNRHMIMHTENVSYSEKYKVCKCHHCLKTFKDRSELKSHACIPIDQIVNIRYPCNICNKIFKNASGLYNHKRNIHKLKGAKILCSVCGNYVSNIYNHMMRHTGEKPFQCDQCNKRFVGKPQLRQHLLVHSGLKPFVCSICAKAFNNLYNLQVHERIHKGDRCHICTICNKGFLEKSYLKKHMNVHTKM